MVSVSFEVQHAGLRITKKDLYLAGLGTMIGADTTDFCDWVCELPLQAIHGCDFRHIFEQKKCCHLKLRIVIASDCESILRIPSNTRALLQNFLAIWPLGGRIVAIAICDLVGVLRHWRQHHPQGGLCPLTFPSRPPGNGNLSGCLGGCEALCDLSCRVYVLSLYTIFDIEDVHFCRLSRGAVTAGGSTHCSVLCKGTAVFGLVGKAGELRLLGAFLPKPTPQKNRGVPWALSPLCLLLGLLDAVLCCNPCYGLPCQRTRYNPAPRPRGHWLFIFGCRSGVLLDPGLARCWEGDGSVCYDSLGGRSCGVLVPCAGHGLKGRVLALFSYYAPVSGSGFDSERRTSLNELFALFH